MTRRIIALLVTLAFGFFVALLGADAQPVGKVSRIGYLSVAGSPGSLFAEAFRQGLRELGYVEGQTIAIAFREAEESAQFPALAAELVQLSVDVIVAWSVGAAQAAKQATTTIPIVMLSLGDPVAIGLVASLAHPGGNLTGLTGMATELGGKRLELLREAVPSLARVAVLWNARDPTMTQTFREIQAAAPALGVAVQPLGVHEVNDIDRAIAALTEDRPDALFMITDMLTRRRTQQVVDFAAERHLPTLFEGRGPVAEGALMSYGPSFPDLLRRAATYVDKILKGAKPADLPVEQPMKFELVINLKTAQALGLTIPPSLLFQADEVIR
jgi:putative tryptophan/tyrosine transport system substrate-binding protein